VTNRGQADLEAVGELLEPEALAGRKAKLADLLADRAINPVLNRRDLERRRRRRI
jgi:hypothetical protein